MTRSQLAAAKSILWVASDVSGTIFCGPACARPQGGRRAALRPAGGASRGRHKDAHVGLLPREGDVGHLDRVQSMSDELRPTIISGISRARHQKGLWDARAANACGNFFGMRKMPGVGDKWGCVPPRPFAPPACLTTRHKGAPSQHPAAAPGPKNETLDLPEQETRARWSCYFFSLPCALFSLWGRKVN
jgi:hypothetical protein